VKSNRVRQYGKILAPAERCRAGLGNAPSLPEQCTFPYGHGGYHSFVRFALAPTPPTPPTLVLDRDEIGRALHAGSQRAEDLFQEWLADKPASPIPAAPPDIIAFEKGWYAAVSYLLAVAKKDTNPK
jgi:hypothetical protein